MNYEPYVHVHEHTVIEVANILGKHTFHHIYMCLNNYEHELI